MAMLTKRIANFTKTSPKPSMLFFLRSLSSPSVKTDVLAGTATDAADISGEGDLVYSDPPRSTTVKPLLPDLLQPRVVIYDGVCHLCHRGVKWVINADKYRKIKFCCLQSKTAEPYLRICDVDRDDVRRRFVFIEGLGVYHQGSTAALRVLSYLPPPYSALSAFMIIPTPLRDAVYDFIAKRRYDWFGKSKDCLVLKEDGLLERFIDREELMDRNRSNLRRTRTFSTAAVVVSSPNKTGKDTFYAEETVSWQSLGLSDRVSQALSNAGFDRPSLVQAACMPSILSGKDVVIAAETGSGKTYGYLVPLIEKLRSSAAQHDGDNDSEKATTSSSCTFSVVLCPNVLLCEQVVRMANDLSDDNGKPLLKVAAVCGRQGWPVNEPDIIVSTPVAFLNSIDPKKHHRSDFIRAVKYVVFDEADMLLSGGFENHVIRLIHMLRFDEKLLSRMNKSGAENPVELNIDSVSQFDFEGEEDIQNESITEDGEIFEGDVDAEDLTEETQTSPVKRNDWRRVRKIYERSKQYIFVAATLPVNGKRTAGAVLKKMFPDANWVNGSYLHQHNPRLKENWIEVTTDTQVDALIEAVKQFDSKALDHGDGVRRTMVFGNTVEAAEAVANILQRVGIECYRYHKDLSLEERAESLDSFREKGGIFVCTDAAARGVDIPNVSHVIQADFASCAVDFLHRVGRTARAGQFGVVTSLYNESNRDLVSAIRAAGKLGQAVEAAFSRKRSFRNKIKKRGLDKARDTPTAEMVV